MTSIAEVTSLLARAGRLPQKKDMWECNDWLAKTWIVDGDGKPYRPRVFMVISERGIRQVDMVEFPLPEDIVLERILQAMVNPMPASGRPGRPACVFYRDATVVAKIAPRLAAIGVACVVAPTSPEWAEIRKSFDEASNTGEEDPTGLASIPGVSLELQARFYELAAAFYSREPWLLFDDTEVMEIRYPPSGPKRIGVMLGMGEEVYGLAVFDTLADLVAMETEGPSEATNSLLLSFGAPTEMCFDDLDAIAEHGWTLSGDGLYPAFGRVYESRLVQPALSDLVWMEGALASLVAFLDRIVKNGASFVFPRKLTIPVQTINGAVSVKLQYLDLNENA